MKFPIRSTMPKKKNNTNRFNLAMTSDDFDDDKKNMIFKFHMYIYRIIVIDEIRHRIGGKKVSFLNTKLNIYSLFFNLLRVGFSSGNENESFIPKFGIN